MTSNTGCVVLAAGLGTRFGGNKLSAEYGGKTLYRRIFDIIRPEDYGAVAVVSGTQEILDGAAEKGFLAVCNERPEDGISRSIRLGLEAVVPCDSAIFLVCDQPLLRAESLQAIGKAAKEHPGKIIVPVRSDGKTGNPCLFPAEFFGELLRLQGDRGGKAIIRSHPEKAFYLPLPDDELADADTKEELECLKQ